MWKVFGQEKNKGTVISMVNKRDENVNYLENDEINLIEIWEKIWRNKKFLIIFSFSIVFLTAIFSLLMDNIYRSESTIITISSSKSGGLSSYAAIAAVAGINLPLAGDADTNKIMAILKSRSIKEAIVKDLGLIKLLNEEPIPEKRDPMLYTIEKLDKMITIKDDKKTQVINIGVEYKNREIAREINKALIKKLEHILNEKSLTIQKLNRVFLEEQVKLSGERLIKLQEKMAKFQKDTKILSPDSQVKGLMDLYGNLVAKKIETQVKLKSMESAFDKNNPQVKALREQLSAINSQISQLEQKTNIKGIPSISEIPESIVNYSQILQDLNVAKAVYEALVKAYEQAKIEEVRDNLYIQVIDEPSLPDQKVKPKRRIMVIVSGFTSLFLGIFIIFLRDWIKANKEVSSSI